MRSAVRLGRVGGDLSCKDLSISSLLHLEELLRKILLLPQSTKVHDHMKGRLGLWEVRNRLAPCREFFPEDHDASCSPSSRVEVRLVGLVVIQPDQGFRVVCGLDGLRSLITRSDELEGGLADGEWPGSTPIPPLGGPLLGEGVLRLNMVGSGLVALHI